MSHPFDITALDNHLEGTSLSADILNRISDLERSVNSTDYADSPITRALAEAIDDRMLKLVAEANGNFSALDGKIDHTDRNACEELDRMKKLITEVDQKQIRYTDTLRREGDDMRRHAERAESRLDALEASEKSGCSFNDMLDLSSRIGVLEARLAPPGGMPDEFVEENTILGLNPSFSSPADKIPEEVFEGPLSILNQWDPSVSVAEGEGPILKDFVGWLCNKYWVLSGIDLARAMGMISPPLEKLDPIDVPKDRLIGEYLVSRGKKG